MILHLYKFSHCWRRSDSASKLFFISGPILWGRAGVEVTAGIEVTETATAVPTAKSTGTKTGMYTAMCPLKIIMIQRNNFDTEKKIDTAK